MVKDLFFNYQCPAYSMAVVGKIYLYFYSKDYDRSLNIFGRVGITANVEKRFVTPIPQQELQSKWGAGGGGNIRVLPPTPRK
jgi:hypothetical protein